jgi:hypothetical protein
VPRLAVALAPADGEPADGANGFAPKVIKSIYFMVKRGTSGSTANFDHKVTSVFNSYIPIAASHVVFIPKLLAIPL